MTVLRTRSITVELIILFSTVIIFSQILALGHRYLDRSEAITALEAVRIADRVAALAAQLDDSPASSRGRLIEHLQKSNMPALWSSESLVEPSTENDSNARLLRVLILNLMPDVSPNDVRVGYAPTSLEIAGSALDKYVTRWRQADDVPASVQPIIDAMVNEPNFLVSVRLSDGTWLNAVPLFAQNVNLWPLQSMLLLALIVLAIILLSVWSVRRLTRPFQLFATAAERLGQDVNAPPIPEQGPSEVRGAISAFNQMQARLNRFLEDRTQMLAAVSHDLRTPITRLRLRAEFVEDKSQQAKMLTDLDEMETMVRGVLSFAKDETDAEPTVRVDLVALVQSICDELRDRGASAVCKSRGRVLCSCRRLSMRRCLTNLIENAVRYGHRSVVRVEDRENKVLVIIDDFGPGIPDRLHEEVFRPFYRIDKSRSLQIAGSGLGLTVARTIARAHGGDVLMSNRQGGGLRVTVVLPVQGTATFKSTEPPSCNELQNRTPSPLPPLASHEVR